MKKCDNCGNNTSEYGSGRFCDEKCRCEYSIKNNISESRLKISEALKIRDLGHPREIELICGNCNESFTINCKRRNQKFCSKKCQCIFNSKNSDTINKISLKRIESIIRGNVNNYGIKMIYNFNDKEIKCDSKIEYSCLDYFVKSGATEIERCDFFIEYLDDDTTRRFNPDFKIVVGKSTYIVEAKSYMSIKSVNEKWRRYNELSILKKKILTDYCNLNNFISFWFTKNLNIKNYNSIKK